MRTMIRHIYISVQLKIERLNFEAPVYFGTNRITLDRGIGIVEGTANLDERVSHLHATADAIYSNWLERL